MTDVAVFRSLVSPAHRAVAVTSALAIILTGAACGDDPEPAGSGGGSTSPAGTTGGSTAGASSGSDSQVPTGSSSTSADDDGSTTDSSDGSSSDAPPEVDPSGVECSTWEGACERINQNCRPWSDDSGPGWNATRCVPILADDLVGVDQPCGVRDGPMSGQDTCALGLICVDRGKKFGLRCLPLCEGSPAQPECFGAAVCEQDGTLAVCIPTAVE